MEESPCGEGCEDLLMLDENVVHLHVNLCYIGLLQA